MPTHLISFASGSNLGSHDAGPPPPKMMPRGVVYPIATCSRSHAAPSLRGSESAGAPLQLSLPPDGRVNFLNQTTLTSAARSCLCLGRTCARIRKRTESTGGVPRGFGGVRKQGSVRAAKGEMGGHWRTRPSAAGDAVDDYGRVHEPGTRESSRVWGATIWGGGGSRWAVLRPWRAQPVHQSRVSDVGGAGPRRCVRGAAVRVRAEERGRERRG